MAELTDAQLLQEAEIIKNETIAGANTAARIGQFIEDMIRSKVSILAPKLLDASTPGYVWMASDTQGNGSWQPSTGGGGGWPLSGSAVFTGDVDINTGIYGFRLQSNFTETTPITYFDFITGSNLSMGMTSVTRGTQQVINYDRWYVSISDFTKEKKIDINYTTSGIVITDSVNSAGFIYAADYSGGATARWLMDKGYGDSTYLTIANPTYTGVLTTGTLGYSDTGILASLQSSTNSYNQVILQNTSSGSSASTNLIISNNLGTSTTHYLEIGKNSSAFTGSGSFNLANASYIDEASDDLVIGTLSNKALHFVTNGSTTDNMSISGAGNITITQPAQSSGWAPMIIYNPGAHTSLTATTEFISNDFKGTSQQWLAGTVAIQRFNYFRGYTLIGASATATFTNAYTLYVDSPSAGTNAAITNSWAAGFNGDIQLLFKQVQTFYRLVEIMEAAQVWI
jgi:hypothetical protein